jgi:nucleoside-diphosphate-sugar epimerase
VGEGGQRKVTRIAITGVGGLIGRRLVDALDRTERGYHVLGLDRYTPSGLTSSNLVFREADVRDPDLAGAFEDCDVVVHLAYQFDAIRDRQEMRSVNVDGTRCVFEAARRAGVGHVVYLSSVVAYGAHPDNDFPLVEDSPIRGTPDFDYAEHKRDAERWLWPWLEQPEAPTVTVLRPALVLGPGVQNFVSRLLEAPRLTVVKGHKPPLQFVHLDDVVSAIVHAVEHRLEGAYNVSAEGWLSFDEVVAIAGKRTLEVPEEIAFTTAERLWSLGISELPPGLVSHLMHPWVVSPDKLLATGWQPHHSNRDALAELVRDHHDHVTLARVRVPRSALRTVALVGTVVTALLGVKAVRALRRRRARRHEGADHGGYPEA